MIKIVKGRITQLHGTTEYWNNIQNFTPKDGEIIVYDDYKVLQDSEGNITYIPGIKIGTGNAYVQHLPFLNEDDSRALYNHINNGSIHVSARDRRFWDNKLNVDGVIGEELIFTKE